MTREEIDRQTRELDKLRTQDRFRALELSMKLIAAAHKIGYNEPLPQLHLWHADLLQRVGKNKEAEDEYRLCIEVAERAGDKLICGRATGGIGVVKIQRYDLPEGKVFLEQAIALALECNDLVGEGLALGNLAEAYHQWGLNDLAAGYAKDSYDRLKNTDQVTMPLYRLGILSATAGDYQSAINSLEEGLSVIKTYDFKASEGPFRAELASVYSRMGQFDIAKQEYERSLASAEAVGDPYNVVNGLVLLAANYIRQHEFTVAEARLREILTRPELPKPFDEWCYYFLAYSASLQGDHQKAIHILTEAFGSNDLSYELKLAEGFYALCIESYTAVEDWQTVAIYEKKLREYREKANSAQFKSKLTSAQSLIATEREKYEKEMEKMKREQLERELSNTTLQLLTQTELLSEFREGILAVLRKAPPTEPIARELREKLKVLPCKSIDWDKFEAQFSAAHPEFRLTLKQTYPDLTKMELRICTLLRMNLKSPDISQLTCLSERNIENHRYRIRKKLGLASNVNIHEFLARF